MYGKFPAMQEDFLKSFVSRRNAGALKFGALGRLDIFEQLRSRIFRIQFCQLSQEFLCLLIPRHGDGDLHFDNLISARAFFGC